MILIEYCVKQVRAPLSNDSTWEGVLSADPITSMKSFQTKHKIR